MGRIEELKEELKLARKIKEEWRRVAKAKKRTIELQRELNCMMQEYKRLCEPYKVWYTSSPTYTGDSVGLANSTYVSGCELITPTNYN